MGVAWGKSAKDSSQGRIRWKKNAEGQPLVVTLESKSHPQQGGLEGFLADIFKQKITGPSTPYLACSSILRVPCFAAIPV